MDIKLQVVSVGGKVDNQAISSDVVIHVVLSKQIL